MNRLKQITAKAKTLYKTGKYKKWTDAIKQASKSLSSSGTGTHKDTKSHNVNVRVVSGTKKKRIGAVKIIQKGETAKSKVTKVLQQIRTKKGQFKGYKQISGLGDNYDFELTRINNDANGNPRYVVHFLNVLNLEEKTFLPFTKQYEYSLKKAKKIGGKKFHNKQYGGGIVFQSFNVDVLKSKILKLKQETPKIKY